MDMIIGDVNSVLPQLATVSAQADRNQNLARTAQSGIGGGRSGNAQRQLNDIVEISAEGRAKAEKQKLGKAGTSAQPDTVAPNEGDKKPGPGDDKKNKVEVGKSVVDDSQWQDEIAKIKQKRDQLLQQINSAGDDENKRKELEAQLAQIEAELASKDTDAYRKASTPVTYLGSQMMDAADAAKLS